MKGYKACGQGHFYSETQTECPYCPQGGASSDNSAPGGKTEVMGEGTDIDATEFVKTGGTEDVSADKTQVFSPSDMPTVPVGGGASPQNFDANKTMIGGAEDGPDPDAPNTVQRRKLRGWLVTFDIEEFGLDFRIIEGRNSIGSNPKNDITIQDVKASGEHAMILYKAGEFMLSDEMSSNGTLLNGEDLDPRHPYPIKDGDVIRIGTSTLLFKTAFRK